MAVRYSPGDWLVLAGAGRWLFAQVPPAAPLVALCWPLVEAGASLDDVLGVIAHEGLRAVGSFAAVSRQGDGSARVIVRGGVSVEVTSLEGGVTEVRAAGVATWLDRAFDVAITGVMIRSDQPPDAVRLPLASGAVLASAVWIGSTVAPDAVLSGPSAPAPAPLPIMPGPGQAGTQEPPVDTSHRLRRLLQPIPTPSTPAEPVPAPDQPQSPTPPTPTAWPAVAVTRLVAPEPAAALPAANELIGEVPWLPPPPPAPGRPQAWAATNGDARLSRILAPQPDEAMHTRIRPRAAAGALTVPAVLCARSHPNPPGAAVCRDCGDAVPSGQQPREVPQPALGLLRPLAGGEPIVLERDVVLGRDPKGSFAPGGPNVIRVPSPNLEVSGTHLAVRLSGWTVTVEDLGSSNGTTVAEAGTVRDLRPGEPAAIVPGAVLTLGGEVALRYEAGRR